MRKVIATAALVALGLAACGSSGGSKGATGSKPSSAFNTNTSAKGGSGDDFSSLLSKFNSATFKVTYQNGSDTFTLIQKPPASAYTSGSSSFYQTADGKTVSCDGTGSSATCTEIPGGGGITQGLTSLFGGVGAALIQAGKSGGGIPGLANITTSSSRTIAGRDATCVKFDGSTLGALAAALTGSAEICLDKDTGVFLEMKTTDDKGKVDDIVATDFTTSVSDSDLTPPVTPSTIPGLTTTTT